MDFIVIENFSLIERLSKSTNFIDVLESNRARREKTHAAKRAAHKAASGIEPRRPRGKQLKRSNTVFKFFLRGSDTRRSAAAKELTTAGRLRRAGNKFQAKKSLQNAKIARGKYVRNAPAIGPYINDYSARKLP